MTGRRMTIGKAGLKRLRRERERAMEKGDESFVFIDDNGMRCELIVNYAKYLIEHLEAEL